MKRILYLLVAVLATSCIYPFDTRPVGGDDSRLVISGDIMVGDICHFTAGNVAPIGQEDTPPDVEMQVMSRSGAVYAARKVNDSEYVVDLTSADMNDEYMLHVLRRPDGREYVTSWSRPLPPPVISKMSYTNDESSVTVLVSADGGSSQHFKWDYEEVYEFHAEYQAMYLYNTDYMPGVGEDPEDPGRIYIRNPDRFKNYYCWKYSNSMEMGLASTIVQTENLLVDYPVTTIPRNSLRLQSLYSINMKMRCISADAYLFLDNIRNNSNISGDLFSPVPSDVRGNIRCVTDSTEWVVGYVDVCAVASKRFFIDNDSEKLYIPEYRLESPLYIPEADKNGLYNFATLYKDGARPVMLFGGEMFPSKTNMQWASIRCVDCVANGGSKRKPEYWPNNHE